MLFNPNPDPALSNCTELLYVYTATRTGNAPDAPTAADSDGDQSSTDTQRQACASRGDSFEFPNKGGIMQGLWTFRWDVFADGTRLFGGTCSDVTVRSATSETDTSRTVITFTQPQSGATAACSFTL